MARRKKTNSLLFIIIFVSVCIGVIAFSINQGNSKTIAIKKDDSVDKVKEVKDNYKAEKEEAKKGETKKDNTTPKEENKEESKGTDNTVKADKNKEESKQEEKPNKEVSKETEETKSDDLVNTTKNDKDKIDKTIKESNKTSKTMAEKYANVEKVVYDPGNNVIVIDPGHGDRANHDKEPNAPGSTVMKIKDGGGASGIYTKVPEYKVVMEVSLILKEKLEALGYKVIMTKTSHEESPGNVERAMVGNRYNAALVLRMHADGYDLESVNGASMLTPEINEHTAAIYDESKRCAKILLDGMINEAGMKNRGVVYRKDITGFNWSTVPVVLVEMGFITNIREDKLLNTREYQEKIATGLAKGILEALPIDESVKGNNTELEEKQNQELTDEEDEISELETKEENGDE